MKRAYLPSEATGFDWDEHNLQKNWYKHQVSHFECEEAFFNEPLIIRPDPTQCQSEPRFYALGQTDSSRGLFIAFTMRDTLIRPISFRDMTLREKRIYAQKKTS
jgi:uncharacterized DUF497 family protein